MPEPAATRVDVWSRKRAICGEVDSSAGPGVERLIGADHDMTRGFGRRRGLPLSPRRRCVQQGTTAEQAEDEPAREEKRDRVAS